MAGTRGGQRKTRCEAPHFQGLASNRIGMLHPQVHTGRTPGAQRSAQPAVPCSRETGMGMTKDETEGVSTAALAGHCDQDGISQMANGKALQKDEGGTGGPGGEAAKSALGGSGVVEGGSGAAQLTG